MAYLKIGMEIVTQETHGTVLQREPVIMQDEDGFMINALRYWVYDDRTGKCAWMYEAVLQHACELKPTKKVRR